MPEEQIWAVAQPRASPRKAEIGLKTLGKERDFQNVKKCAFQHFQVNVSGGV